MTALVDRFGRHVEYVRLSVTDRCDFRCVYCMAEDMVFTPRHQILSLEELAQLGRVFSQLGVKKIRITGGEPLIRKNIICLFEQLGALPTLDELTLTSNGSQLVKLAQPLRDAGVKRINISLDSLNPALFKQLTRTGDLQTVLDGIKAAKRAQFDRIKINAVILKNRNDNEILPLVNFCQNEGLDISFIEEMPLGNISEHNRHEAYMSSDAIKQTIEQHYTLQASDTKTGGPSRYFDVSNSQNRIGFISPHSHNFCGDCNRVRVTAEGRLLLCLGNEHSVDLKTVMRSHPGNDDILAETIIKAMDIKPERHFFDLETEKPDIVRFMNMTGG